MTKSIEFSGFDFDNFGSGRTSTLSGFTFAKLKLFFCSRTGRRHLLEQETAGLSDLS